LEASVDGRVVVIGGPRVRAVLALLLAELGRVVSVGALVDGLWGERTPADAERTVRAYVSRLRKALQPAAGPAAQGLVVTRPPGYQLRVDPDAVDAGRFERLAVAGRQALESGRPAEAAQSLAAALQLWRGDAYGEFGDIAVLSAEAARLERLRLAAVTDRIDADLAAGMGHELVAELEGLTGRYPSRERLWGQLMTALYRSGRQVEALGAFRRARQALLAEFGGEPSRGLVEIHRRVLAQDFRLLGSRPAGGPAATAVRPAQLPLAVSAFVGREAELAALDRALDPAPAGAGAAGRPAAVVISAVSGTAGVGKTALAVHWAHRVADRFPDGQLYVNLRGYDPGRPAMPPAEAVRAFLDAFGVPPARIPASLDGQAALYRSLLAGRRVLVVLDNARDADQARPLLPGTPTALAVVTSRNQLTPLVVADGAHPLTLDLLSTAEAGDLLAARLGPERIAAESHAVSEIIARCAGLPLALTIAAARASQSRLPLAVLAAQLADGERLDVLDAGDPVTQLRAVLAASYSALSPPAARLFRLLGLHPGPDTSAAAAASLAGQPLPVALRLLAELTRANLLSEHTPGRYAGHDLLRAYAADRAHEVDPDDQRRAAVRRLLDHYLHTSHAAERLLNPVRNPIPLALRPPAPGAEPAPVAGPEQATSWLTAEHPVLLGAVRAAADAGLDAHAWQLTWALSTFLSRRGQWPELAASWQTALAAADRLDNPAAQAGAHRILANTHTRLRNYAEADTHYQHALRSYAAAGDLVGQAHTQANLTTLWERQEQAGRALAHAEQALALYQAAGHQRGQANALNHIGWCQAHLGDHAQALASCRRALALCQQLGDREVEASTWDSLGYVQHCRGEYTAAADSYHQAIALARSLGDRYNAATTLNRLGDTEHSAGRAAAAGAAWHQALEIFTEFDDADAGAVRLKLDGRQLAT
jgi:DNA-binding SARP family transcriptional activator